MQLRQQNLPTTTGRPRNPASRRLIPARDESALLIRVNAERMAALTALAGKYETTKQALVTLALDRLLGVKHGH
ncbi:MAG: hypothetical protein KKH74_01490 [Gammaproteobacteria bacterium]|nr:hypothetical protein [Gammaproteobacteria bacterium]MBU1732497.1 hypothetical protein [Gammaproteobacteria bacterium]MBU1892633.1 hypothetical protein [Gammaproteobacteria bacterium]